MKFPKEYKRINSLMNVINRAKEQARIVIDQINEDRAELDDLESNAKKILKL